MFVYRISKKSYINDLSGIGAGLYGGRWNPKGMNMVYTSSSIALASLEYLVHNYHLLSTAIISLAKIEVGVPSPILEYQSNELPENWNLQLGPQYATQQIGRDFILNGIDYMLKVPSAVVPGEFNLLLNPYHSRHSQTKIIEKIDPFVFDKRILNLVTSNN
jgi:RES domain-containing protein